MATIPQKPREGLCLREFPKDLRAKAKAAAALQGLSLQNFIVRAVESSIKRLGKDLAHVS